MTDPNADTAVLVVDDDEDLAETYARWLERSGYRPETAFGGERALARLDTHIDVVLLDRRMPRHPGDEVLAEMRERPGSYQVSMLTAVEPAADILELPFDEYLTKPVDRELLVDTVESLVRRQSLDGELQALFRLVSKRSALQASDSTDAEPLLSKLDRRIRSRRERVDAQLRALDDYRAAFALAGRDG
jgi:DNA-binding response OmpR family regulator